jgi:beta-mannosidase
VGLSCAARALSEGAFELTVSTVRFAQSIAIHAPGYLPDDNFFHLAPGASRAVRIKPTGAEAGKSVMLQALNASAAVHASLRLPE